MGSSIGQDGEHVLREPASMRKLFLGLAFAAFVQSAWSSCPADSTFILKTGTPGFTAGNGSSATATYDPSNLNAYIHGCAEGTITVHLNIDQTEAGKTKDTVKLTSPILIGGRA